MTHSVLRTPSALCRLLAASVVLCGASHALASAPPPSKPASPPAAPPKAKDGSEAAPTAPRLNRDDVERRRQQARELTRDRVGPGIGTTGSNTLTPVGSDATPPLPAVVESTFIRLEPAELDLGEMFADTAKTGTVRVHNISESPVTITRLVPSCGCTTAPAPKDPIAVGGFVDIPITLKPGPKQGVELAKRVTFQIDGAPPVIYTVKGKVAEFIRIAPELLTANTEDPESGKIVLTAIDGEQFKVLSANPPILKEFSREPATEHTLEIDWVKWQEAGSTVRLAFSVDHPRIPSVSAMIKRTIQPRDLAERAVPENRTPPNPATAQLITAARAGNLDGLKSAIESGAKLDEADRASGRTALHWAAREGRIPVITALLESGAALDIEDRTGKTALTIAAESGQAAAVETLVVAGSDINHRDRIGGSPLLWAAGLGNVDTVKLLIARGAEVNVSDVNGLSPLLWAAGIGDPRSVTALLDAKADPKVKDRIDGDDALIRAVRSGRPESIKLLLAHGCDLEARNDRGDTALLVAAASGSPEKVALLLEAKADVSATNSSGHGVLHYAQNRVDPARDEVVALLEAALKAKSGG